MEIDDVFKLLAGVVRQAQRDARKGSLEAKEFVSYLQNGDNRMDADQTKMVVNELGEATGVQLPKAAPAVDDSERAQARREFAYAHGIDVRYLANDFTPSTERNEPVRDPVVRTPADIAAAYGVNVRYVQLPESGE